MTAAVTAASVPAMIFVTSMPDQMRSGVCSLMSSSHRTSFAGKASTFTDAFAAKPALLGEHLAKRPDDHAVVLREAPSDQLAGAQDADQAKCADRELHRHGDLEVRDVVRGRPAGAGVQNQADEHDRQQRGDEAADVDDARG